MWGNGGSEFALYTPYKGRFEEDANVLEACGIGTFNKSKRTKKKLGMVSSGEGKVREGIARSTVRAPKDIKVF